jgi:type II secretory pathway component PulK
MKKPYGDFYQAGMRFQISQAQVEQVMEQHHRSGWTASFDFAGLMEADIWARETTKSL